MRNVFGLLLGSAIVAAVPAAANAQDYYAREHIAGLKPIGSPEASFSWSVGSWSDWSSTCARNAVRTRSVICRDDNGQAANDAACSGSKPESSQTQTIQTGCVIYNWQPGEWSEWSSHCSEEAERTRTVSCVGSDGSPASDDMCVGTRPETSQIDAVLDQCPPPNPVCEQGIIKSLTGLNLAYEGHNGFSLTSLGYTEEAGSSAWLVKNTTDNARDANFKSGTWSFDFVSPPKSEIYIYTGVRRATGSLRVYAFGGGIITLQSRGVTSSVYPDCR